MTEPLDEREPNDAAEAGVPATSPLAADDRLDPAFVSEIVTRLDQGDTNGAQELVEPLHPANIADLFELLDSERRHVLAQALGSKLDGDVLAEMNDWVREDLIDVLSRMRSPISRPSSIRTTRSRSSRIWKRMSSAPFCAPCLPMTAPRLKRRCPIPRNPPAV